VMFSVVRAGDGEAVSGALGGRSTLDGHTMPAGHFEVFSW
jgi:hypothetical protein